MIIIVMLISGALAGLGSVNSIMGSTHYLSLNFVGGAGFVGIAIALMGRQHPVGIFLSAVLFGALIQGGFDLSLEKQNIPPETFIFIQGLIILFCGAMENFYAPAIAQTAQLARSENDMTFDDLHIGSILVSTVRNAPVLIFAGMAGLFAERSRRNRHRPGRQDPGQRLCLGGGRLQPRRTRGTASWPACWCRCCWRLCKPMSAITQKGNQLVAGIAINIAMSGLTFVVAQFFFQQGGRTPDLGSARLFDVVLPGTAAIEGIPFIGWLYGHLIGGHSALVYLAFALIPLVHWVVYHSRFGLRLRACGENPHAADAAGVSVERTALHGDAGRRCPVLVLGRLPGDRAERLLPARHVGRRRLPRADGAGVR
jgi:ABC-type uncharacterized transport system permease subunit